LHGGFHPPPQFNPNRSYPFHKHILTMNLQNLIRTIHVAPPFIFLAQWYG